MYFFDAHQDLGDAFLYASHGDFWRKNDLHEGWNDLGLPANNQIDIVRLKEGKVKALFGVSCAFGVDSENNIIPCPNHLKETLRQINMYHNLKKQSKGKIKFITKSSDVNKISKNELNFLLAIEGADSIDEELINLDTFFNLGVRSIGLTWSYANRLSGGCNYDGELLALGKKVVRRMNELGIILDLAHIGEKSFYDALEVNKKPAIISHTCCKAVYDHPRNVTDDQIKAIASTGGAVGIYGIPRYVNDPKKSSLDDIAKHILHVIDVVGINHVIIGSDFGAMLEYKLIKGFQEVNDLPNLTNHLKKKYGLTKDELDKISHKNLETILVKTLPNE